MLSETVELRGHIIDSLILPKVLDEILKRGGNFKIGEIKIGQNRVDQSFARIEVSGSSREILDDIILRLRQHGADVIEKASAKLEAAPANGVFPEDFYVTTNNQTFVDFNGTEIEVQPAMMDGAIAVDRKNKSARAVKFQEVKAGMEIVVGQKGIRVAPVQRAIERTDAFEFMRTSLSVETPKNAVIREMARELKRAKSDKGKILVVAGPAVVHTGGAGHLVKMIEGGFVDLLFSGNALAAHDIEGAIFGTSLGIDLERGAPTDRTHQNHLRAINAVRGAGGIKRAVENGILKRGIMHACVKHGVDFVLAGSIRDDGPLPEVITDSLEAQRIMREKIVGLTNALMISTALHSMAVASLLPASVKTLCIDINPTVVNKLTDRETFQALGIVTDVEGFLRELTECLAHR